MISRDENKGTSRPLPLKAIRERYKKYYALENEGKHNKQTYHAGRLPCFVKKREGKSCDDCRYRYTRCDGFAGKHPEFAKECIDYYPIRDACTFEDWYKAEETCYKDS